MADFNTGLSAEQLIKALNAVQTINNEEPDENHNIDISVIAADVSYDNTESELESNNIQAAIDEVAKRGGQAPLVIEYTLDEDSKMNFNYLLDGVTEMKSAIDSGRDVIFKMTFNIEYLGTPISVEYKLVTIMDEVVMGQRTILAYFGAVYRENFIGQIVEDISSGLVMMAATMEDPESGTTLSMTQMAFGSPGDGGGSASETTYDSPSGHSEYGNNVQSALDTVIANLGNRVTNITSSSTDNETPSAKATYDLFDAINSAKVTTITDSSTDDEYPSAKAVYDLFGTIESALEGI